MIYPTLSGGGKTVSAITTFLGYDHNDEISDGEFYDTKNMTSDLYPIAAVREKRDTISAMKKTPQGIIAKNRLYFVYDDKLYYGEVRDQNYDVPPIIDPIMSLKSNGGERQLVSMGAYIIIFPDKMYYNTANGDYGSLETTKSIDCTLTDITLSLCDADGTDQSGIKAQNTAPTDPAPVDGDKWVDTSGNTHYLKVYSKTTSMWVTQSTTYVKIKSVGLANTGFKSSDGVKITGLTCTEANETLVEQVKALNGAHVIKEIGQTTVKSDDSSKPDAINGYIIIPGIIDKTYTCKEGAVEIKREVPDMDFVAECNNRVWGCKYGLVSGETVNEIYGSALGDPFNFTKYEGVSTDSYSVSLGSDGEFTGAITHLGYILFFKENCIHKIYGNYPANFQVITTACRGVQKGCEKSLVICDEVLFYKSPFDVCRYTGSLPEKISAPLGNIKYKDAAAGSINGKYYINMADETGVYSLFCYDTAKGIWMKEDNTKVLNFAKFNEKLYYIAEKSDGTYELKTTTGGSGETIEYCAQSGKIGFFSKNKKYVTRVDLRLAVLEGSAGVFIRYDSTGDFVSVGTLFSDRLKVVSFSVRPKRCDHFEIKIAGTGSVKLFGMYLTYSEGSSL